MGLSSNIPKPPVDRLPVLLRAQKLKMVDSHDPTKQHDVGQVGDIVSIDPSVVKALQDDAFIPVISPIGFGEENESYNINADTVAGELAAALGAVKMVMMTDVEGIYQDFADKDSLIREMSTKDARQLITDGHVDRGMIPKVEACVIAVTGGVERASIIDGRLLHSLLIEMFTHEGIGTMIK